MTTEEGDEGCNTTVTYPRPHVPHGTVNNGAISEWQEAGKKRDAMREREKECHTVGEGGIGNEKQERLHSTHKTWLLLA